MQPASAAKESKSARNVRASNSNRLISFGVALALAVNSGTVRAVAGTPVLLGVETKTSERVPMAEVDHTPWDLLLGKYVDVRGMIDYTRWKASKDDTLRLSQYLQSLSLARMDERNDRSVQLAFWINAYNAVTVAGILREYPTTSIRNHTAKLWGYNIWKDLRLRVDGQQVSLDEIEHQILRPMGEPRIHFAIVCASISCPRLRAEAFHAERVDQQLTDSAVSFFADRSKFSFDLSSGRLRLSPILSWFAQDFGKSEAERLRTIAPFVPQEARQLTASGKVRVSYLGYDWGLNDQKTVKQ